MKGLIASRIWNSTVALAWFKWNRSWTWDASWLFLRESGGHRLCRHLFVDWINADDTKLSKLCIAACKDKNHKMFNAAHTMKRTSLHFLLAVAVTELFSLLLRGVGKASIMSKTPFCRENYTQAPEERNVQERQVLDAIMKVYRMLESPIWWYKIITDYQNLVPKMS